MKQIIITIPVLAHQTYEAHDFLKEVEHSPKWLGAAEEWEIHSIHVHKDKQDKSQITALLENPNWVAPEVKAMTGNELYEAIKRYPDAKVKIATLTGINCRLSNSSNSKYGNNSFRNGHNVLIFDGKDEITVKQLLKEVGHEPEPEDAMDFQLWHKGEENRKEAAAMPIAIQFNDISEMAYPLTGVRYENREVILIYNQDVEI